MIPFYLLVLLPVIVWAIRSRYTITYGNKLIYETRSGSMDVFMLFLMILLALRGIGCGIDTKQYKVLYEEYSAVSFIGLFRDYEHEFGFKLLNKLIGITLKDFQWVLVSMAVMSIGPIWYMYKRESDHPLLTIALFLSVAPFVMYFSGIRQAAAMAFAVPVFYASKQKKFWTSALWVLLAMQLHTSAFILFLIYPLYHARITTRWLFVVVPCMIVLYIFKTQVFEFLMQYLWDEYHMTDETGATTILILLILFVVYAYVIPDEQRMDQDTIAMRNLLWLAVAIQCFAPVHPLAMRMNYYFLIFVPVLIPKIADLCKPEYEMVAKISVIVMVVYFLYYFINNAANGADALHVYPYVPFWKS